jgi:ribosome maturation factor RimP
MYKQNKQLVEMIGPVVEAMGYELVGIEYLQQGRYSQVRIYIDKDRGISLADCEAVSHQVTGILDVEDPVQGAYNLEVSSPGLDRPLFTLEQFRRYTGQEVKLNLGDKIDGRRKYTGKIATVGDDHVVIESDGNEISIPADMIRQARIIPEFD